jgi:HlyD family secretion protein
MKTHLLVVLAVSLIGASCSLPEEQGGADSSFENDQALNTSVRVRVVAAEEAEIGQQATVSGVIEPFRSAVVAAEVGGRVLERLVEPGDRVEKSAALIRLDDERVRISRTEALARRQTQAVNLAEARNELKRGEDLREQQFISDTELDGLRFAVQRASSGLRQAEAALAAANRALEDSVIRAPFPGTAELVHVQTGDFLNAGSPVATMVDFSRARVRAGVTAREAAQLASTETARVALEAIGSAAFDGTVHSVGRISDTASGTYPVEIWIDNPSDVLREGMLATVHLPYSAPQRSLVVPSAAVFRRDGQMHVFTVSGDVAIRKFVRTGRGNGALIEIVDGLAAGELVVFEGQFALRDGARVIVREN